MDIPKLSPDALMAMQLGGMATSTIGSFFATSSQKSSLEYQAQINKINAGISEVGAQSATLEGQKSAQTALLKGDQANAAFRARAAANGVDIGQGSASEVQTSNKFMSETDAINIEAAAARSAIGYRTQASSYNSQANMEGATAGVMSPMGTAGSALLSGGGQVANSWYLYNKYK